MLLTLHRWKITALVSLKVLSHEIFRLIFWTVCMHLGLNVNHFCFFLIHFFVAPSTLDSHFKSWHISCQTFSEIPGISEKDWQLCPLFSNFHVFLVSVSLRQADKAVNILGELRTRLSILLWDFKNPFQSSWVWIFSSYRENLISFRPIRLQTLISTPSGPQLYLAPTCQPMRAWITLNVYFSCNTVLNKFNLATLIIFQYWAILIIWYALICANT